MKKKKKTRISSQSGQNMNKKKITFKNESYIKKNQDQFLYWKQWIDPKIIIFLKLILQKINFALWTCDSK